MVIAPEFDDITPRFIRFSVLERSTLVADYSGKTDVGDNLPVGTLSPDGSVLVPQPWQLRSLPLQQRSHFGSLHRYFCNHVSAEATA